MWETWREGWALAGRRSASADRADGSADGHHALESPHAPTARIVAELKQARSKLETAVSRNSMLAPRLAPSIRAFRRIERLLDRPLRVAVIGEFNSGKSSLANLMARVESLPTAVVSNTRIPTLLYYARKAEIFAVHQNGKREWLRADLEPRSHSIFRLEVGLPSQRLRVMQILDFPGLADPRFPTPFDLALHDVGAVLWCTVSTQAWKESERIAWSQLPSRLWNRGLLVSTHGDLLHDTRDVGKLLGRLRSEASSMFRSIVLISTVDALALMRAGHQGASEDAWKATGAEGFETALHDLLVSVREQRAGAALRVTSRIADRALSHIEKQSE